MATSFNTDNIGGPTGRARRAVSGLLFALLALLAAVTAAQDSTSQPAYQGPRLAIPEKEIDFGVVKRGKLLEATFTLHNVGTEPLKILRVKPG